MEVSPRPSRSRLAPASEDRKLPGPTSGFWGLHTALWALCYFIFYLTQQVAEVLAPLCVVLGIGWMAIPHALKAVTIGAASTDPQTQDVINHVVESIPANVEIGRHFITPGSLVLYGFLLMAIAALGATISAVAARKM